MEIRKISGNLHLRPENHTFTLTVSGHELRDLAAAVLNTDPVEIDGTAAEDAIWLPILTAICQHELADTAGRGFGTLRNGSTR